jgi:hypothetical protein
MVVFPRVKVLEHDGAGRERRGDRGARRVVTESHLGLYKTCCVS